MYNLGEQFNVDRSKAIPNEKSIIKGDTYRFTLLTDGLIRMEYNKTGVFYDEVTELVLSRSFPTVEHNIREDKKFLEISTSKFKLSYVKNKPFMGSNFNPMANLKVMPIGSDKVWYFGHPEIRNFGAPALSFENTHGKLGFEKGLYSADGFASLDDSKSLILEPTGTLKTKESEYMDIYLFVYGSDFNKCLSDYFALTGYPALLPRYALGNWWSRNINYSDTDIDELITNFDYHQIPMSVLLLNADWHMRNFNDQDKKSGYTWNKERFVSPEATIEKLHHKGIRLGLNIDPSEGLFPYEQQYTKALPYVNGVMGQPILLDLLNPRLVDVYFKLFVHPLDNAGVDFFWIDTDDKKKLNDLWILNHYHFNDMKRDYKRRPMVLSRNHRIAAHRYPVTYTGKTVVSWNVLKTLPFYNGSGANLGVSYYSHDIGGYYKGTEDNELYIRYVQLGVFSPILKFGADDGKYYKREPWRWSIKTHTIAKDYLTMRHRLIPYLYTEAYNYYKNGTPLIKPLYHTNPETYDDVNYRNEYFFGSQLFVSPIINKKDYIMDRVIHKFYMPAGIWYDFSTGKKFPGEKAYTSFYKDQDYPVFARQGAIIPFGNNENINDTTPPTDMEIQIFPGQNNSYKLYEDDGLSDLYRKGYHLTTVIDYNYLPNNYTVIVRALEGKSNIIPEYRNYKFRFRNTKQADEVIAYFNSLPIACESYLDGTDFVVEIKEVKTIGQLTINCKGKDIEMDAVRIINDDIQTIISDLQIPTELKEKIDDVLFGDLPIKKKRIGIQKLRKVGLERKFIKLFLKLLEYINNI